MAVIISNDRRTELARKVAQVMPGKLKDNVVTYFAQSGSGAVETAIKFVRKITGRSQIAAFHGAYHGVWCGSNSLTTGDQYRKGYGPFMSGVVHLPYPYCYRCCFGLTYPSCELQCAKYVDYVLNTPYTGADDVRAVIIEAQQGEGGYVPPPPGALEMCGGRGLMIGIEMVEDKETREPLNGDVMGRIIMGMLNRGMLMVPCGRFGNVFRFMPPLVLTREHAAKAVDILIEACKDV
ncbi:MAG: aminotransferase class III-fold pyridoxal phosphate-dependent enzyme [Desulfovermiculus sp.]|nr:aminotransferase class III-fold pyridoxal phosphate-dependent enzyme [Desulfovermiculus sp.]